MMISGVCRNHFLRELRTFFEDYKKLENKTVEVEDFQGAKMAKEIIEKSIEDYNVLIRHLQSESGKSPIA